MNFCPNKSHSDWKYIVEQSDEITAYKLFVINGLEIPTKEFTDKYFNSVSYNLKGLDTIMSNLSKIKSWESNKSIDVNTLWNKVQQLGISKQQIELLKKSEGNTIEEKLTNFVANYTYTVEINLAEDKQDFEMVDRGDGMFEPEPLEPDVEYDDKGNITNIIDRAKYTPTQYYSNLTVPGGTNYTENEIATPQIIPSIKGHAQFATDKGIGWFRSDDRVIKSMLDVIFTKTEKPIGIKGRLNLETGEVEENQIAETKTRRILELQSDLFQKGRDKKTLSESITGDSFILNEELYEQPNPYKQEYIKSKLDENYQQYDYKELTIHEYLEAKDEFEANNKQNQFLQLLNKDNNWVTFFVKSIIQDSAKKGYEKVLFPTGDTASKVEGHTTLEEFKKQKEDRIKELEEGMDDYNYELSPNYYFEENGKYYWEDLQAGQFGGESVIEVTKEIYDKGKKGELQREATEREINQLKQELERIEGPEGFGALKPIYNFYENVVANVLKKQEFNPKVITDEYGNTWNEVTVEPKRDLSPILLRKAELGTGVPNNVNTQWLKDKLGMSDSEIVLVKGLIDNQALGGFMEDGRILLAEDFADDTTMYHEAFHRVFNMYASEGERNALISEVLNSPDFNSKYEKYSKIYPELTKEELAEEILAEEFAMYAVNGETEQTKSIFKKIMEFIKKLLNLDTNTAKEMYERINAGYYKGKPVSSQFKRRMNSAKHRKIELGGLQLTSQETLDLISGMDTIFLGNMFIENPYNLLTKKVDALEAYQGVKSSVLYYLREKINSSKNIEEIKRLGEIRRAVDTNFSTLVELHKERVKNNYRIVVDIENAADILDASENQEEVKSRNALDIRSSIEYDTKTSMPPVVKMLIASLSKVDSKGNIILNRLGLPKQVNKAKITNLLFNQLSGLVNPKDMFIKIQQLAVKYPELNELLTTLDINKEGQLENVNFNTLTLRNQFVQTFAKNKYNFYKQLIEEGKIKIINANADQTQDKILQEWQSRFNKVSGTLSRQQLINALEEAKNPQKIANILGISFSKFSNYTDAQREISQKKTALLNTLKSDKKIDLTKLLTDKANTDVNFKTLAELESKDRDSADLQFINADGKTVYGISLNTYQTLIANEINRIVKEFPAGQERETALKESMPQLFNAYTGNSLWLKQIIDGNNQLEVSLYDGSEVESDTKAVEDLSETDLLATFFNATQNSKSLSLKHADRAMYPVYNLGNYKPVSTFSKSEAIEIALPIFKGYLEDLHARMNLGSTFKYYAENRKSANILEDILSPEDLKNFTDLSDTFIDNKIRGYLNRQIDTNMKLFKEFYLLKPYQEVTHIGIPQEYMSKNSYGTAENYIGVNTVNWLINHVEETKIFTGDPSFYKNADDFFKRLNTQSSTGEIAIVDDTLNEFIQEQNKRDVIKIDGKEIQYTKFGSPKTDGTIAELVFEDEEFISGVIEDIKEAFRQNIKKEYPQLSEEAVEKKVDEYSAAYTAYNENDGISLINMFALRESMLRFTDYTEKHEATFQEELKVLNGERAWDIPEGADAYAWFSETFTPFVQQKYQYSGINYGMPKSEYNQTPEQQRLNAVAVRKTSYFPLIPSNIKGTNLEKLNKFMLENGVDTIHMFSAAKVGARKLRSMYDTEGNLNLSEIQEEEKGYLDFKYFKKQVEISPKEKGTITDATQSRKNIIEGIKDEGKPKDYAGTKEEWEALSDEEKLKQSELHSVVEDYQATISGIVIKKLNAFLQELKAEKGLKAESYEALSEILTKAAKERNSADNIIDAVQNWARDLFYIEALPNAEKIQNLLNSLITNNILTVKRLGAAMPQASVTGFETAARNITDKKIQTSDALKFYTPIYDQSNNIIGVNPAEIILPLPPSWLDKAQKLTGKNNIIEIVDELNRRIEQEELTFELKGLRIPNQQLSSNDILRVKKFSYPQLQQAVIVPSELVAKTGGDFDIDKLQMYYYHTDNKFKKIEYLTEENSTVQERAARLVKSPKDLKMLYSDVLSKNIREYFNDLNNYISQSIETIKELNFKEGDSKEYGFTRLEILKRIRQDIEQDIKDTKAINKAQREPGYQNKLNILYNKLGNINAELFELFDEQEKLNFFKGLKKELIDKVAEDIKDKPILEQNTSAATENHLLELETKLILNPSQLKSLYTPIVDTDLKKYAEDNVKEGRNKKFGEVLDVYTNIKAYRDFVGGKAGVGQYATWITHLALAQTYNIQINPNYVYNEELVSTELPFEGMQNQYSMGNVFTKDAVENTVNEIAQQYSQFLTSQVDNVKDPYAVALQIITQTNNTIAYMTMRRIPLKTILDFMTQPVIIKYLFRQRINESQIVQITGRDTNGQKQNWNPQGLVLSAAELQERVAKLYPVTDATIITDKMLEAGKKGNNAYQRLILKSFIDLQRQASAYSKVKTYLSPDTKFLKNKDDAKAVVIDLYNEIKAEGIVPISKIEEIVSKDKLLHGFYKGRDLYYNLFKSLFMLEDSAIAQEYEGLKKMTASLYKGTEAKNKAISVMNQEFMNYFLQKHYLDEGDFKRLMLGDNSFPKKVLELQQKYPENVFLDELVSLLSFDTFGGTQVKIDGMKSYSQKLITDEHNFLIDSFEELLEKEPWFKEDYFKYNLIQAGTKVGPYQLNKFIPYSVYAEVLDDVMDNMITVADLQDFYPKYLSVYSSKLPSKRAAEYKGLPFYREYNKNTKKYDVYYFGQPVTAAGKPYKTTYYLQKTELLRLPKVVPAVSREELLNQTSELIIDSSKKINIYAGTGENSELSNFANRPFILGDGITYPTVEHAFQLEKFNHTSEYTDNEIEDLIKKALKMSASQVKSFGKTIKGLNTKTWDRDSSEMMKQFILESFRQNPDAAAKLLATGNAELTHTQDKTRWGIEFPKLLMEVREELRFAQQPISENKAAVNKEINDKCKGAS